MIGSLLITGATLPTTTQAPIEASAIRVSRGWAIEVAGVARAAKAIAPPIASRIGSAASQFECTPRTVRTVCSRVPSPRSDTQVPVPWSPRRG